MSGESHPFWSLAFRPFFLGGAIVAVAVMAVWLCVYAGVWSGDSSVAVARMGWMRWHAHEMIYGFAAAIVCGFLLTASRNWTGMRGVHGRPLMWLFGVYALARILPFIPGVSLAVFAVVDLLFLLGLIAGLAPYLARKSQRRNVGFLALLVVFLGGNALFHYGVLTGSFAAVQSGLYLGLGILCALIVVIGGRVIPFFTERVFSDAAVRPPKWLDWLAIGSTLVFLVAFGTAAFGWPTAGAGILAFLANAARFRYWIDARVCRAPILWILFFGYGWLTIGFGLGGVAALGALPRSEALHALTVGGIGVMILGMMSRVSLGHTGRPIRASRPTVAAYVLVNLAAALRVVGPMVAPAWRYELVVFSGALWMAGFAVFLGVYTPILLAARVDGKAV